MEQEWRCNPYKFESERKLRRWYGYELPELRN